MFLRLFLLFTLVPFIELVLLIKLASLHGWAFTIALILFTGVIGTMLVRWQGLMIAKRIQKEMSQGKPPTDSLMDGAMILVAGALLITPGILTDLVGFLLLWPLFRSFVRKALRQTITQKAKFTVHQQFQHQEFTPFDSPPADSPFEEPPRRVDDAGNEIIDVEFTKRDE